MQKRRNLYAVIRLQKIRCTRLTTLINLGYGIFLLCTSCNLIKPAVGFYPKVRWVWVTSRMQLAFNPHEYALTASMTSNNISIVIAICNCYICILSICDQNVRLQLEVYKAPNWTNVWSHYFLRLKWLQIHTPIRLFVACFCMICNENSTVFLKNTCF